MKEKIEKLKWTMENMDETNLEVVAELEQLDAELIEKVIFPGQDKIERVVDDSIENLTHEHQPGVLAAQWAKLGEDLEQWEQDHPRITKVVGDIARALGVSGL